MGRGGLGWEVRGEGGMGLVSELAVDIPSRVEEGNSESAELFKYGTCGAKGEGGCNAGRREETEK